MLHRQDSGRAHSSRPSTFCPHPASLPCLGSLLARVDVSRALAHRPPGICQVASSPTPKTQFRLVRAEWLPSIPRPSTTTTCHCAMALSFDCTIKHASPRLVGLERVSNAKGKRAAITLVYLLMEEYRGRRACVQFSIGHGFAPGTTTVLVDNDRFAQYPTGQRHVAGCRAACGLGFTTTQGPTCARQRA